MKSSFSEASAHISIEPLATYVVLEIRKMKERSFLSSYPPIFGLSVNIFKIAYRLSRIWLRGNIAKRTKLCPVQQKLVGINSEISKINRSVSE